MKPQITAVLIDSNGNSSKHIQETLRSFEGVRLLAAASDLQEGIKVIQASAPHIVILEVKDVERGAREIEFLLSRNQQCAVFVTCAQLFSTCG